MPDLPRNSQNNVHAIQAKSATSGHATSKQITGNLLYGKLNANRSKKIINCLSVYTRTAIFEATAQHLPGPTSDPNAKQARLGLLWNSSHAMVTMNAMVPTNWLTQTLQLQFVPSLTAYFPDPSSHMVDPQDLIATVPLMPRVFFPSDHWITKITKTSLFPNDIVISKRPPNEQNSRIKHCGSYGCFWFFVWNTNFWFWHDHSRESCGLCNNRLAKVVDMNYDIHMDVLSFAENQMIYKP